MFIQKSMACGALVLILLAAGSGINVQAADNVDQGAAVAAAQAWLANIDKGNYGQGWKLAASYLKANVQQKDFTRQLTGARKPLGQLVSRKVLSKQELTSVPGGPDGHYVVIQFDSVFSQKKSAVETVTPMLEKDGKWRVSGYFIK